MKTLQSLAITLLCLVIAAALYQMDVWNPILEKFAPGLVHPKEMYAPQPGSPVLPTGIVTPGWVAPTREPETKLGVIKISGPETRSQEIVIDSQQWGSDIIFASSLHGITTTTETKIEIPVISLITGPVKDSVINTSAKYGCQAVSYWMFLGADAPKSRLWVTYTRNPLDSESIKVVKAITGTVVIPEPQILIINGLPLADGRKLYIQNCWEFLGTVRMWGVMGIFGTPDVFASGTIGNITRGVLDAQKQALTGDKDHKDLVTYAKDHAKETPLIQLITDLVRSYSFAVTGIQPTITIDIDWQKPSLTFDPNKLKGSK